MKALDLNNIHKSEQKYELEFYEYLFNQVFNNQEEKDFVEGLLNKTDVFLFGGVIRDYLFSKYSPKSENLYFKNDFEDIDFVVSQLDENFIKNYIVGKTQFGGFTLKICDHFYDIWEISKTWNYKDVLKEKTSNFDILKSSVFFSFNSVSFHLNKKKWRSSKKFDKTIRNNMLDIVFKNNPNPHLCIMRAYKYSNKYKLKLSPNLRKYIQVNFKPKEFEHYQLSRYDKLIYSRNDIFNFIKKINYGKNRVTSSNKEVSLDIQFPS